MKQELQQSRDQLAHQEGLTHKYFTELSKTDSQLVAAENRASSAEAQNRETSKLISQLRKDHQALVSSARWRWGSRLVRLFELLMLRKKQPLAVDHMQDVLSRLEQHKYTTEKISPQYRSNAFYNPEEIKHLNTWLRQLNHDYELLKKSLRWKTGHVIIRTIELLTFKSRQTIATDHLGHIFQEYQEQSTAFPIENTKKLQTWLRQAKNDFYALKKSMRWRTGNRIFSIIDALLFRWKKQTAMDHALRVAAEYENWEKRG